MVFVPKRRRAPLQTGDPVRVIGRGRGARDDGSDFDLRGESGRVVGSPYRHRETGERMVGVVLESGDVVAIPRAGLKHEG